MIRKRLMGLALSCAVFASSCYMSLVPAQAVVRDNVGGMDTSIDSGSTDKDGNTAEGSASKNEILKGFGAWVDGELVVGTMPNNGFVSKILDTSNTSYTIPEGYHNGSGTINVVPESKNVTSLNTNGEASVSASTGKVLSSVSIKIPTKSVETYIPGTTNQKISAGQYLSGDQTIKGDANLVADNILKGKSIFGVNGTVVAESNSAAHTIPSGKTVASEANILSGKTAWNGTKWIDGDMADKSNTTTAASSVSEDGTNAKIQIPASGFYNKDNSYITVPVETLKNNVSSLNSSISHLTYFDEAGCTCTVDITKHYLIIGSGDAGGKIPGISNASILSSYKYGSGVRYVEVYLIKPTSSIITVSCYCMKGMVLKIS